MQRNNFFVLIFILGVALTASGCDGQTNKSASSSDLQPGDATARLDPAVEDIIFPLDEYTLSTGELNILERAQNIDLQNCMVEGGQPIDLLSNFNDRKYVADRVYGIWSMQNAQIHGYGLPDEGIEVVDLSTKSAQFNQLWDECSPDAYKFAEIAPTIRNLVDPMRAEAGSRAREDDLWKATVDSWHVCLDRKGLAVDPGDPWLPTQVMAATPEDQVRIAVQDVECKEETQLIQTLANLESSYQISLVRENEAALKSLRDEIDTVVSESETAVAAYSASTG